MQGRHTASGHTLFLDRSFPYPQFNRTKRIWVYLPTDYFTTNKNYSVHFFKILYPNILEDNPESVFLI
jgi:hypothetical protein